MDKLWISALTGALTGGLMSSTSVVLFGMSLWGILIVYPLVGLLTAGIIYGFWSHLEAPKSDNQSAITDNFSNVDALLK